jgi:hypothetical protein
VCQIQRNRVYGANINQKLSFLLQKMEVNETKMVVNYTFNLIITSKMEVKWNQMVDELQYDSLK